ncbi:MAG: hypothetical protein OES26_19140, partial [Gammaproteobacteria bacterium]|nr:hypothetical protein [Gammaproteobacteria bacterium]
EQILGAAPQISELLSAGPGLKVLVTSRAALRIRDEHEFPVPPLALPSSDAPTTPEVLAQCASVAMFIERAAAIKTRASWGMWFPASNLGSVAAAQGYAQRAVCLAGAATTITEAIGVAMVPSHRTDYEDALATARQALSTSEFDAVWSKGISMTLELAVDYALSSEDESLV